MTSNYYIPQTAGIKNVIGAIWQVEGHTSFHKEHILPKGIVEIIFNFSHGTVCAELRGKQYDLSRSFINGFNTAPVQMQLPEQQVFFGIQVQPVAVKKIFGIPAAEFTDRVVDLTLVDPRFSSIWHQLAEQPSFDDRVAIFLSWAEKKVHDWQPQEQLVNDFLSAVDQHDLSVMQLAYALCYSTRHLSRKLFEATGLNTEEILLYKKYLHAVHLIHHSDLSLTQIAYESNFSDQSHFIKSFKSYSQMTPGEYRKTKSNVKGHVYVNVR